ncbi:MAG: hypothetical protein ACRD2E_13025 [Terriglobales bacterium]
MIVFRHARQRVPLSVLNAAVSDALPGGIAQDSLNADSALRLLLAASTLECSLSDAWGAEEDSLGPAQQAALNLSLAAAACYLGVRPAQPPSTALAALRRWLPPAATILTASRPEGFRYYALSPSAYIEPARQLSAGGPEGPVLVIGLRTIGSSLAPVVAAVLRSTGRDCALLTLRPRGRPEDRAYRADAQLRRRVRQWPGPVAVVDEGPGLSGSSFGGAVAWLQAQGIPPRRIVLLPSWNPPARRLSHTVVAQLWDGWRKLPASPVRPDPAWGRELSGGRWRTWLTQFRGVPVWPQEERVKFLSRDGRWLFKYSGLGAANEEAAERSRRLARHGFSLAGISEGEGWLRFPWLSIRSLEPGAYSPARWARWAGRYLAYLRSAFAVGGAQPPSPELQEMTIVNVAVLADAPPPPLPPAAPPVRVDGRVLWQEWGIGPRGHFVKFDALDHGDDHFFPGPADIAWDLAGLECEFGPAVGRAAQAAYQRASADRDLAARLPWHRVAYAAFRAAYADFAQELVGPPDAAGFRRQRRHYVCALHRALATAGGPPCPSRNGGARGAAAPAAGPADRGDRAPAQSLAMRRVLA